MLGCPWQSRPVASSALAALLSLGALSACGPEEPPEQTEEPGPLAIGRAVQNGDPDFVAFSESDALPLAFGGQGGLHLNVHLRLPEHPAWQRPPWVSMSTRRVEDGSLVSRGFRNPELEPAPNVPGEWKTRSPLLNLMCPPPVGLEVIGEPMELTVEVYDIQDPDGPVLFGGSARYVPVCPADSEPLCLDWCTPT